MADTKISDLTAIAGASLASTDLAVVVDVSDTTMAASGTDKKTTVADLATAITTVGALATDAEVTSAISTHNAVTTSVHGIANTANLYAVGGTDVAVTDGGTGSSTASGARTNLGLVIGTDVQAYDAQLADLAGITFAQGDVLYFNGTNLVKLAAGTSGHFLKTQGAGANPTWDAASGSGSVATDAIFDAKGDLPVGTGANTAAKLTVGSDGTSPVASTNESTGLIYARPVPYPTPVDGTNIYVSPVGVINSATAAGSARAQIMVGYLLTLDTRRTLAGISTNVATLESGATARLGVYACGAGLQPGALVADYGTIDASTTGTKEATGSTVLDPGCYILAGWASNHTTVRYWRYVAAAAVWGFGTSVNRFNYCVVAVPADYSAGLPSNWPTFSYGNSIGNQNEMIVWARFS